MKYILLFFVSFSFGQIAEDKMLHFFAGNLSGTTGYLIGDYYLDKPQITGIGLAIASGVLKETYDFLSQKYFFFLFVPILQEYYLFLQSKVFLQ